MDNKTIPWVRIRFETRVIGPADTPLFRYIAAAIGHNSMQYAAMIPEATLPEAIGMVKGCWPDAVIYVAERGTGDFPVADTSIKAFAYGIATEPIPAQKSRMAEFFRKTTTERVTQLREVHALNTQLAASGR